MRRPIAVVTLAAVLLAACSTGDDADERTSESAGPRMEASVASYDVAVGPPARFIVGLFDQDKGNIGGGSVAMRFRFLGAGRSTERPESLGPAVTARFLPIPGAAPPAGLDRPAFLRPSEGRGVYGGQAGFDRPGFWEVTVTADVAGTGRLTATAAFEVLAEHRVPAPGEQAPAGRNLTLDSTDVPRAAIDSRALDDQPVPDPELHRATIADAMAARRPVLVVFSTPTFCVSRFCGPVTDMVAQLARDYADRAVFVHVEVWRDFEQKRLNDTAAEWLTRGGGDGNEPWVFLVGADGRIVARWDNVATRAEIEPLLRGLPPG